MSAQHTPGPWEWRCFGDGRRREDWCLVSLAAIEAGTSSVPAIVADGPDTADGILRAAAPDLLTALIAMRERWELYSGGIGHAGQTDDRLMRQADAAIAKATGAA
ncbi:MAG: hypothetical protein K2X76_15275 [Sphingomonas sp.]|nr:hypothetical protein [Sphingomonas sp.]